MEQPERRTDEPSRLPFRADIEGLRAVAILVVVLYHAGVPGFSGGYIGVDMFFVLSGYLITQLVVNEAEGTRRIKFARFYARRFRRLMPASALVLLTTLAFSLLVYSPLELKRVARSAGAVSLYVSNIMFARERTDYLAADGNTNPFLHTWSLAVEEQFYFVWPLLLLALYLVGRRWSGRGVLLTGMVLLVVGSFATSVVLTSIKQPWAFYSSPPRFWEFAVGGAAALMSCKRFGTLTAVRLLTWVGVGLVLVSAVRFGAQTRFPGPMALFPVLGTTMLLVAGSSERANGLMTFRALAAPPMQWLGGRSYSWYLWHWPLLVFLLVVNPEAGLTPKLVAMAAALGLSAVTYVCIENPARENGWLKQRSGVSIAAGLGLAGICLLAAVGVDRYATNQLQQPDQRRFEAAAADTSGLGGTGCELQFTETDLGDDCALGDTMSDTTVVLVGDSHAGHWFPALQVAALDRGWRLVVHTKSSCPAPDVGAFFLPKLGRTYTECSSWRNEVTERILAERPSLVVMSNSSEYDINSAIWSDAVRTTAESLNADGIALALITDVPRPAFDVPICLSKKDAGVIASEDCSIELPRDLNIALSELERSALEGLPSSTIVDMTPLICSDDSCPTDRDGMVLYSDSNHLTATFSRSLADDLAIRLSPLLRPT